MHDAHEFLKTLAIVLGVAAITTVVFQRLKQPVVLGYIIAGLVVGPHLSFPLNADPQMVQTLSELGVILLMFAIGLELTVEKLVRVAPTAGVIGVIQVALMIGAGLGVGRAFGWSQLESVFAGSAIAISSTTIIAKVFDEMKIQSRLRELVYGVLIVEDIIAILLLATMNTVSSGAGLDAITLVTTTGKLLAFLLGMVVVGILVVPRLMRYVVRLGRPETTVVASIGICFGLAYACVAFHYSVALGAFVAGMLISESGEGHTVEHLLMPVRDMFAAIFFVSVGMLIDPRLVLSNLPAVLVLSVVVIVGKVVSVTLGGVVTGSGLRTSVQAGMSLAQIGEFSFIIASLGLTLEATRPFLFPVAVAVSAITTLTTPALIRRAVPFSAVVERRLPRPVTSFVSLYSTWLERARGNKKDVGAKRSGFRRLAVLLVIDSSVIIGLILGAALLRQRVGHEVALRSGLGESLSHAIFVACIALVGLPFLFGIVRLTRALGLSVVGLEGAKGTEESMAARSIALVVQLGLLSAVGAVAVVIVEPFLPRGVEVFLFSALLAAVTFAFWRQAKRFDSEVQAGGAAVMEMLKAQLKQDGEHDRAHGEGQEGKGDAPKDDAVLSRLATMLPGLGKPRFIRIEGNSHACGRSLSDLELRAKTGAAVLAIVRGENVILMPGPREVLDSGDVVAAVGSDQSLTEIASLLGIERGGAHAAA